MLKWVNKAYGGLLKTVEFLLVILGAAMILLIFFSVLSRYILNFSIAWMDEASRFMFIWMLMLGTVLISDKWGHMSVDFVVEKMPNKLGTCTRILATLLSLAALAILIVGGFNIMVSNLEWYSSGLNVSYGIVYAILPLSCLVIFFQGVSRIGAIVRDSFASKEVGKC